MTGTSINLARRNLLRGIALSAPPPIRPPWALAESQFVDVCNGCGDCISACPEAIVIRGDGGYPEIDFANGPCTFCGQCVAACEESALLTGGEEPWSLQLSVADTCLANQQVVCQSCRDVCDQRAIRFEPEPSGLLALPVIDPDTCNGCGACISTCPVDALTLQVNPEVKQAATHA